MNKFFTRYDIEQLVREGEKNGLVNHAERDIISRMLLRGKQHVKYVMVPRTEMTSIGINSSITLAVQVFEKTGHSRIPVTGDDIDQIIGIIHSRDILFENPHKISDIIKEVIFIPESLNIAKLFKTLQMKHVSLAIAVDEYGGTAGLITIEDIIEEFFGDIQDEYDEDINLYRKISTTQLEVNARVDLDELNQYFDLNLPLGNYQTLGGFLIDYLGYIPRKGEKINTGTFKIEILSANRKKINWVHIFFND